MKKRMMMKEFLRVHRIHPLTERRKYSPEITRNLPDIEIIDIDEWFPDINKANK